MPRKIAVITGTRAEYGILQGILQGLKAAQSLQLIVTGAHLWPMYGLTVERIEADGFEIAARVDMQITSDEPVAIIHAMSRCMSGIAEALNRLKPDMVVVTGDRYEMLAAAMAAAMLRIPMAHVHGGEVTTGALDESMRHAITKLSHWHFASAKDYAARIIQMGESPSNVFTVGAPGLDLLESTPRLARAQLQKQLGMELQSPILLVTYHPETLSEIPAPTQITALIEALQKFPQATLLISGSNADCGGAQINEALQAFAQARPNALFRMSYGSSLYINLMRECDVLVGNSSSGIIEAPALGKAVVNIGERQSGRLRAPCIIDCPSEPSAIAEAITHALTADFQHACAPSLGHGVPGGISKAIVEALHSLAVPSSLQKPFHDLK